MRFYTTTEAAAALRVDPSRIRLLCKMGRIETIKVGNTYGIAENEVQRLIATPRRPGRPRQNAPSDECLPLEDSSVSAVP
jgi:excisionase family DNA binding protein